MPDMHKLRREHAELIEIAGRLSAVVELPDPPPMSELFTLRHELAFTLIAHLKGEDWVVYPRLFSSSDARVAQTACEFSVEMGSLANGYVDYAEKWNSHSIEQDWSGYCAETRCIIEALTTRITREDRELYSMFEAFSRAA